MRLHFGFSFRPSLSWLKWIGLAIAGLFAFFGIGNHAVLAYSAVVNTPTSAGVLSDDNGANYTLNITPRTGGVLGDNYYINFGTPTCGGVDCDPVFNGYVYWNYPAKNLCTSGMIHYKFSYFTRSTTPPVIFPTNNFSTNYSGSGSRLTYDSTNKKWTVTLDVPNNQTFQIRLGFENSYDTNYYFVSSAVQKNWEYSCDYSLADSTNDIISNNDANTQKITDKLENHCPNLYNFNNGRTYSVTTDHDDSDYYIQDKFYLEAGTTYYFKWKSNKPAGISGDTSEILLLYKGTYDYIIFINNTKNAVFTPERTGEYQIRFDCNKGGSTCTLYDVMVSKVNQPYCIYGSSISLIDSNTQNTQQIIDSQNDINNSLNNDNVDGSLNTGNSFFDNFTTPSTTGFRGIVTAPIRIFQEMINNNACSPLRLDLLMSDDHVSGSNTLSLPCGNILWDRAPGPVVALWHTLIIGVLVYRLLLDLVRFVNNLLNPESTKEYLMEL